MVEPSRTVSRHVSTFFTIARFSARRPAAVTPRRAPDARAGRSARIDPSVFSERLRRAARRRAARAASSDAARGIARAVVFADRRRRIGAVDARARCDSRRARAVDDDENSSRSRCSRARARARSRVRARRKSDDGCARTVKRRAYIASWRVFDARMPAGDFTGRARGALERS